jgi:diguanylate cyclase (GGDEF)-like protein/PAS domain S-box-containing protein
VSTPNVPKLNAGLLPDASRPADMAAQLARLTRSAAHAANSPIAVMYLKDKGGFAAKSCFGLEGDIDVGAAERLLSEATDKHRDSLLIINDRNDERDLFPSDDRPFGAKHPEIRFAAAAPIVNAEGEIRGSMIVADIAPRAGLSGATTYVLRTHASQICTVLELESWRKSDGGSLLAHRSNIERLRLLESVVVNANDSVLITEAEPISLPGPRIVYCNAAFTRTTGYTEEEVLGKTPRILQSERTDKNALAKLRAALVAWKPVEVELLNTTKDGVEFWVELSIAPVADERGWFTHWISVQRNVSDRKNAEEATVRARLAEAANEALCVEIQERKRVESQLLYAAFHDDLTKLRNRPYFMERLGGSLSRMKDNAGIRCAVLFIDLDRFKMVNDSLGHRAGDLLLMEVSRRMESCLRPTDILARIGGDEFAVLIEGGQGSDRATNVAGRIIEAMQQPIWIGSQEVFTSCTIGVVQATESYSTSEELLRDADIAMYDAKRNDKGGVAIFAGSMHESAVEALKLQTDLQNALVRNEFFLDYQPICHAGTTDVVGLEALIRWRHPTRGLVSPLEFIGSAEQTGIIRDIGRWVVTEACHQMRAWCAQYPDLTLRLSINSSGRELEDPRFIPNLQKVLAETELDPKTVELEVTEAIFLRYPEQMEQVLRTIRTLGVRVALDDFGTGYSSLSYLDRYEIDTIKIDQTFVGNMLSRPRTMAIVHNIVGLAHALHLEIVAEGVEGKDQLCILAAMGCTTVQGYHLSRPMSVAAVDSALANQCRGIRGDIETPRFVGVSDEGRLIADRVA